MAKGNAIKLKTAEAVIRLQCSFIAHRLNGGL
jgi:hypothetical protein